MSFIRSGVGQGEKNQPSDVKIVQELLNWNRDRVVPSQTLAVDGKFGWKTRYAIERFQRAVLLMNPPEANGRVRPDDRTFQALCVGSNRNLTNSQLATTNLQPTYSKMNSLPFEHIKAQQPPSSLANGGRTPTLAQMQSLPGMSEASRYDLCTQWIASAKANPQPALKDLAAGKRVVLGLRKTTNTQANHGRGIYDDLFVVLWKDSTSQHAPTFVGNTEPSAVYEHRIVPGTNHTYGGDANLDRVFDLGRIPDGVYTFKKDFKERFGKKQDGKNNIFLPTKGMTVERDINHDGKFDEEDKALIKDKQAMDAGTSMYFHRGNSSNGTGSAGCQTMPQSTFDKFWQALGPQNEFQYVLITVR